VTATVGLEFESVAQGFYLEGLLIDGDTIWFTDVAVGGVQRAGSNDIVLPDRAMIGGLLLNENGVLLVAGGGGVIWIEPQNGRQGSLIDGLDGVNEMCADGRGGMFFGTIDLPSILRGQRPGTSTIRHLSAELETTVLRGGLTFANGLAISPDRTTLYFNESFSATRAFGIRADGTLSDPRTLLDMSDCDGMAMDAEGNIWVTGFASGELRCVTPDGSVVRRVELPGSACTNIRFGGADLQDLYVTIVSPASAQALAEGRPLELRNSALLRTRSPVPGARVLQTGFAL
jgi:sugar lactone lactonase YvrE